MIGSLRVRHLAMLGSLLLLVAAGGIALARAPIVGKPLATEARRVDPVPPPQLPVEPPGSPYQSPTASWIGQPTTARALMPELDEDVPLPLDLELVEEGRRDDGRPFQVLRATFKEGGTLSLIALALYDDEAHTDAIYDVARQQIPQFKNPAMVRVGMSVDFTVDPSTLYALRESALGNDGRKVRTYWNGVRETIYAQNSIVRRVVEFPDGGVADAYVIQDGKEQIRVPAAGRVVYYEHNPSESLVRAVEAIYGLYSFAALADFTQQTKWNPTERALQRGEKFRLVLTSRRSYADPVLPEVRIISSDETANRRLEELSEERARAGVVLVQRTTTEDVFRVQVKDPTLTARDISRLLYGQEDQAPRIAEIAGFKPRPGETLAPDTNPLLLGRAFSVTVDQADERFILDGPRPEPSKRGGSDRGTITLINGTVMMEYQREPKKSGLLRAITYPSGYRKFVYRPHLVTRLILDYILFLPQIPEVVDQFGKLGIEERERRIDTRASQRNQSLAVMLWNWDPGIPRAHGDVPERSRVVETGDDALLHVDLRPRSQIDRWEAIRHERPFILALAVAAIIGLVVTLVIGPTSQRVERRQKRALARAAGRPQAWMD